jgi:hypothetical protein
MWETTLTAILLCSVILSIMAIGFSIYSMAKVIGFEKSTHKIEYKHGPDLDIGFSGLSDEQKKSILSNEWMDDLMK